MAVSWSTAISTGTLSPPTENQLNRFCSKGLIAPCERPTSSASDSPHEPIIASHAGTWAAPFSHFPKTPMITHANSGSAGINHAWSFAKSNTTTPKSDHQPLATDHLPLHFRPFIHVQRRATAEQQHHQPQGQRRL